MKSLPVRFEMLALFLATIGGLFGLGVFFADIDTDISRFLPRNDPVLSDAAAIFEHHPMRERVAVDLRLVQGDRELLLRCGKAAQTLMEESGLFESVGLEDFERLMPGVVEHVLDNLPYLFSDRQMETVVAERLRPEALGERFESLRRSLLGLEGIGQASHLERDPLELKNSVLGRLASLAPAADVRIVGGMLLSSDGRHLLVPARPAISGTDTAFARKVAAEMERLSDAVSRIAADNGGRVETTAAGAYRAALDNETIIRNDVNRAILLAALGIAVLLLFSFHRPWMGLLAFLPALAGTAASFLVCALVFPSLSIMALGFGGAVISITVDHSVAYLLFLDQRRRVRGAEASEKLRSVGLVAALTTMGAFGMLCFGAFPVFRQLGLFSALGIGFSFLFVHTFFPKIFPDVPPAKARRPLLRKIAPKLASGGWKTAWIALAAGAAMLFFARPEFDVRLSAMNTVGEETKAAQDLMAEVWGDSVFKRVYLMTEGESLEAMRASWDELLKRLETDADAGIVTSAFVPSMLFPGERRREENFDAWREFWGPQRRSRFLEDFTSAAASAGFRTEAFEPFLDMLSPGWSPSEDRRLPEAFFELSGLRKKDDGGGWMQFSALTPGPAYDAEGFRKKYGQFGPVFDADRFSRRLGELLFENFVGMLAVVGMAVALLILIFFWDWKLAAMGLLPVAFAMACALGVLNLTGRPLDLPGLMLAVVVFGMGIDYALYIVRGFQRWGDGSHPDAVLIETGVFMASASTMIGFGVLVFSDHSLLQSAGVTSLLGIGFASVGAFAILPPMLENHFRSRERRSGRGRSIEARVLERYRKREAYPRFFARFKLRYDPMFSELPEMADRLGRVKRVLDVGCGFGVPACWIAERFPDAAVFAIDPDRERVRIAALALGESGRAEYGFAPEIPKLPEPADAAFMLDIAHFLADGELERTLERLARRLRPGGTLVLRCVVPPESGGYSRMWRFEAVKSNLAGVENTFRSAGTIAEMVAAAGFEVFSSNFSGGNEESIWFVARLSPERSS